MKYFEKIAMEYIELEKIAEQYAFSEGGILVPESPRPSESRYSKTYPEGFFSRGKSSRPTLERQDILKKLREGVKFDPATGLGEIGGRTVNQSALQRLARISRDQELYEALQSSLRSSYEGSPVAKSVAEAAQRRNALVPYNPVFAQSIAYKNAVERARALEGQVGGLKGQVGSLQGQVGSLQGEIGSLQGEVGNLRNILGTTTNELNATKGTLANTSAELINTAKKLSNVKRYGIPLAILGGAGATYGATRLFNN